MENATNALLIAGGVLIAIIIISMAVYLYTIYSNQSKEYSETISNVEIQKFNSNFEVYIGRTDIKPQEIVSAFNLSKEYDGIVSVVVDKKIPNTEQFLQDILAQEKNENKRITYNCRIYSYYEDGRIKSITFKKNT